MDFKLILQFWFTELTPSQWWLKDEKLDLIIRSRFAQIHNQATLCELINWRDHAS